MKKRSSLGDDVDYTGEGKTMRNMPMHVPGSYMGMEENSPPALSSAVRGWIAACLVVVCLLVGCSPAIVPAGSETEHAAPLSHDELNQLIESLANHNEEPMFVPVHSSIASLSDNPLFGDNYDWDEDERVWSIIREFKKNNNSEGLWHCLLEHLDDGRYVVVYAIDDEAYIVTIGGLCRNLARDYLDGAYMIHLPRSLDGNRPAMRLFSPEGVGPWCRDHAGMPLYQQQAELCEAAIEKMQTMPRVSVADKSKFASDVKRQIDALRRTKQPFVPKRRLLPGGGGKDFYNAGIANEIKEKYLAERNAK